MSKKRDEEYKGYKKSIEEALADPELSPEIRTALIEKRYSLPHNVNMLNQQLYYDILYRYYDLKCAYKDLKNRQDTSHTMISQRNVRIEKLNKIIRDILKDGFPESTRRERSKLFLELMEKYEVFNDDIAQEASQEDTAISENEITE